MPAIKDTRYAYNKWMKSLFLESKTHNHDYIALHKLVFMIFLMRKFHIQLFTTYFQHPKTIDALHFIIIHFQIKYWNVLYHIHTCIAALFMLFLRITCNVMSTDSTNQNIFMSSKPVHPLTRRKCMTDRYQGIGTPFLVSQDVALWLHVVICRSNWYWGHAVADQFPATCCYVSDLEIHHKSMSPEVNRMPLAFTYQ